MAILECSHSLHQNSLEHMLRWFGASPQRHLQGVVNAPTQLVQVTLLGVSGRTGHKQIRKSTMDVETSLLTAGSGSKYTNHWNFVNGTGSKLRVANVQVFDWRRHVVVYLHNATAEEAGWQRARHRGVYHRRGHLAQTKVLTDLKIRALGVLKCFC